MEITIEQIKEVLSCNANGLKAKELSEILDVSKNELNSFLYSFNNQREVYIDKEFRWHLTDFVAIRRTTAPKEKLPENIGKKWDDEEKAKLMEEYMSGMPMINIADLHKRTELAIASMVVQIINEDKKYESEKE